MNSQFLRLAKTRVNSAFVNQLYLKTGIDYTRPIHLHAQLNYKCNSRCVMCDSWGKGLNGYTELPAEIWNRTLGELKAISPNFKASFAGGEILQKQDVFDIFRYCQQNDIVYGMVTSGILLSKQNTRKLIDLNPFNVHISVDSLDDDTYEAIRGLRRLDTVKRNIAGLLSYINQTGSKTAVSLKTIVCNANLDELDSIVRYAAASNINGVTFQTVFDYIDEAYQLFVTDLDKLQKTIDKLIRMKEQGYPILNSPENMQSWIDYYKRAKEISPRKAQLNQDARCVVSLLNVYVLASGEVKLCELYDEDLGNLQTQTITEILSSDAAKEKKKQLTRCQRNCVYVIKRTAKDYVDMARHFVGPSRKTPKSAPMYIESGFQDQDSEVQTIRIVNGEQDI